MRTYQLLRNRDFTILWTGRAISDVGSTTTAIALPLLALGVGSAADAGFVVATITISGLTVTLYAGAVVDRFHRRNVMIGSVLVRALALAAVAASVMLHRLDVGELYVVAVVLGCAAPFFSSAETAAIRLIVPAPALAQAYSRNQARSIAASLVGSPAGGALYALGRAIPFAVDALSFVVEAAALSALRTPLVAPSEVTRHQPIWGDIGGGLRFVWRNMFLRTAMLAGAAINFATLWPAMLITLHDRGISPRIIGIALAGISAASLCGALVAPRAARNLRPGMAIVVAAWWLTALTATMAIAPHTAILLGALLLAAAVVPLVGVLLASYESAVTPDRYIGRVSSANRLIAMLAIPAGQALGGIMIDAGGPRLAFSIYGAAVLAGTLILTLSRTVRQLELPRPND